MIPFSDDVPSRRFPLVTVGLIVCNVFIFLYEIYLGPTLDRFLYVYGVIPAKWILFLRSSDVTLTDTLFPYFSSMFLHGGWLHLIGNMWYLWIFGDNVEDRLGHVRFLLFYLLCGLVAGLAHTLFNIRSVLPCVGASGAIAGVLGAYWLCFPNARVLALVPIFFFVQIVRLPAAVFLFIWFFMQFLNSLASLTANVELGGVAWLAHVAGFISGILFIRKMRYN